ncbi:MAG: hypothetical protein BWY04_00192 [candidate division CPR1 bacterium ADurb.Bin160]|jgi:hypothetical protein|uniref:Uncharacterized protein n=1 Tax=candidate division CPR1 bacterium ADurb.Bin160 TaxID=1852826 RepID=A0A1V5ZR85_9BACT|nr:MAG: hypothetical protein BWY04_00192 [candidate division CPR1 bacterium ADurb.Bin160]
MYHFENLDTTQMDEKEKKYGKIFWITKIYIFFHEVTGTIFQ